jgi:FMN-dependent NADH-azoreductase
VYIVGAMKTLLVIDSSARTARSTTRHLTRRFASAWAHRFAGAKIIRRDIGVSPVGFIDEVWIAAAFTPEETRTATMSAALASSEVLIREIEAADAIVIGAPMYNFGMPAALKAYFDQIIRVGRTFDFIPDAEEHYRPLLAPKPVFVCISCGDGEIATGGKLAHLDFLEPHLRTLLGFLGQTDVEVIRAGHAESGDDRHALAIAGAEKEIDSLVAALSFRRRPKPELSPAVAQDSVLHERSEKATTAASV